jgi:hypothetical protein
MATKSFTSPIAQRMLLDKRVEAAVQRVLSREVQRFEPEERVAFAARLFRALEEHEAKTEKSSAAPRAKKRPHGTRRREDGPSYTDRAEAYVLAHPNVSVEAVAKAIGQATTNTHGTLRFIAKSRGTIKNRDGKWAPTKGAKPVVKGPTVRQAVLAAIADGQPRGAGEIAHLALKARPDASKNSVGSEINRLKSEGTVVVSGSTGRGALYALVISGGPTVSVAHPNGGGAQAAS